MVVVGDKEGVVSEALPWNPDVYSFVRAGSPKTCKFTVFWHFGRLLSTGFETLGFPACPSPPFKHRVRDFELSSLPPPAF